MKKVLLLDDEIYRKLKEKAMGEGKTISEIVLEALRGALLKKEHAGPRFRLKWRTCKGRLLPGVDVADRDSLYEKMEGGA